MLFENIKKWATTILVGGSVGVGAYYIKDTTTSNPSTATVVAVDSTVITRMYDFISEKHPDELKDPNSSIKFNINRNEFMFICSNMKQLTGQDTVGIAHVIAILMAIYNESGGSFTPKKEFGGPKGSKYFFETVSANGVPKLSYNTLRGNIPAGTWMVYRKILHPVTDSVWVKKWNGTVYPDDAPQWQKDSAENADFNKYAGNGYIQITGRANYMRCVAPEIPNIEYLTSKQLSAIMNDKKLALRVVNNYMRIGFNGKDSPNYYAAIKAVDKPNPDWDVFGHQISGPKTKYVNFARRCTAIYEHLKKSGFDNIMLGEKANHDTLQKIGSILESRFNEEFMASIDK